MNTEKNSKNNQHPVYLSSRDFSKNLVDEILICYNRELFHKSNSDEYKEIILFNCSNLEVLTEIKSEMVNQFSKHSLPLSVLSFPEILDIRATPLNPTNGNYYGIDIGWFIQNGWFVEQEVMDSVHQQA